MAQVKKFQKGGGLYLDGKLLTDEQINAAMDTLSAEDKYTWSKSIERARSGERVDLNELANSVTGGDFSHVLTERQLEKNASGNLNRRQRNRHARWNTNIDSTNRGIANGISALKAQLNVDPSTKDLGHGSGWFKYGDDGSYISGPTNTSNEKIIRDAFAWLAGDENYRKGWTTEGYGEGLNGLTNWYSGQNVDELIGRIKNKTLTAEDYDVLSKLGFVKSDSQVQTEQNSLLRNKFQNAGYDFDTWSPYFEFDKDGNMVARTIDGQSVFASLGGNGNYWFNDNFSSSNPNYDFLKGHFLIGNRLYKESDASVEGSDLYNYLRRSGGFYDLNNIGRYNDADALISYMWGNNAYVRPETTDNLAGEFYGSGIRMDNTNYRTAETELPGYTFQDGDQIVRYVDLNTASDPFGLRKDMYAVVDRYGNYRTNSSGAKYKGLDYDDFTNLFAAGPLSTEEEIEQQVLERTARLSSDKNNPYYNRYRASENPYYDLYIDPSTGDAVMNPKGELSNKWLFGNNKGIKLTPEVAEILQKPEFINALQSDPDFAKKFRNTIQSLTGTDWQDLFKRNLTSVSEFPGINETDAQKIIEFFYEQGSNKPGKSKAYTRRNADYIVDLPTSNKFGGKFPNLPKFQSGGAINAGQKQVEKKSLVKQPVKSHTEQGRIGIDKLSAAEKAELISIGMDVLGTITGLAGPVGDIAGSSLGLAASTTQLGADISRAGKLTLKDTGRFLMNAGLDAVGLLPVFGDGARTAKTVKNIQKASKWLMPVFSTAGLSAAASSVDKIMKGETMTVDDWGNLAAGFQAITGIGSSAKQRWGKSKIASEMSKLPRTQQKAKYSYTPAGGEEITLDDSQVKAVLGRKEDAKKYLTNLLKGKGIEESAIPEDIVKKFGFEESGIGRFGSVNEKELPKEISNRSVLRFFATPGLNKYIEGNTNKLRGIVDKQYNTTFTEKFISPGKETTAEITKKTKVADKELSRTLAQIIRENDLEFRLAMEENPGVLREEMLEAAIRSGIMGKNRKSLLSESGLVFKQGGKIQFAKDGKKITKHQNPSILPDPMRDHTTGKLFSEMTNQEWKTYQENINASNKAGVKDKFGFTYSDLTRKQQRDYKTALEAARTSGEDFIFNGYNFGKVGETKAVPTSTTPATLPKSLQTAVNEVSAQNAKNAQNVFSTMETKPLNLTGDDISVLLSGKRSTQGNLYGEKTSGLNWGDIGNQLLQKGLSVGDLLSNLKGSKNQLEFAKQMQVPLESKVVRKNPGFNDNGIALAYDQQIGRLNSVKGTSSDYLTNFAIERSYKDTVSDLLKQKDLAMSQAYANWQNQNQQKIAQQDEQDRQIEFANNQRLAQKHNSVLQAQGAHEAQVRQSMSNFSKQLQQEALQKQVKNDALKKMQFQTDYTTQFANPWQDKYKAAVTDGSKTFAQWLNDNPALRDQYQQERLEWQKKSVFKKGGKVRPAGEQIWIDKQKFTAKAVERLSKQAYELLKMALS